MSDLRVVNATPTLEQPPYFTNNIHANYDDRLDSPISTPGIATHAPFYTTDDMSSSRPGSAFGLVNERDNERYSAEPMQRLTLTEEDEEDEFDLDSFNLKPPPPAGRVLNSLEALSGRFFSADHLDTILSDQSTAIRLAGFLETYLPQSVPTLKHYSDAVKAVKAVDYANAIANQMGLQAGQATTHAATLDDHFRIKKDQLARELVDQALPAHLTHQLVSLVTDTLVKEITGNSAPVIRALIPSLAEVYCISDPSIPDNPIVYASEGEISAL